ncbi:lysM domain-containing GPI-anchored protein 2 [Vigna unguiculata]|uniref:Chitin elicitor-binding protein n=1 Tax=Vigna unguiculata TaxID=3917 RepID=A0A4D6L5S4_VIGUN|nr:lysM domain-containing GPI-anchored protein 2 [Vigna unguiculata]QCD83784.1 chitin elicitor-binding protein [Vigna unguiculata]
MGFVWMARVVAVLAIAAVASVEAQPEAKFVCNSANNSRCGALIGYSHTNGTTLGHIQTLFNVKKLVDILGANNLPSNTTKSHVVEANEVVKVPFPCRCSNRTGLSDGVPLYKIKKGDTLYDIATTTFGGLVKYPQITAANKLPDENNITTGDTLYIPLPCSCDVVDGSRVVHFAHLVVPQSTVEGIAEQFGTTEQILLNLNGISDPKTLQAGQILDVPLRACSSSVKNDSLDYPLLVANSSYAYTANECVKCSCDPSNNYILQCEQSHLKPTNWSICPSAQCSSNVFIGNTTSSTDSCNRTVCAYTGFTFNNISAELVTQNTCAVPPGPSGGSSGSGSGSGAPRSTLQGLLWSNLFVVVHFVLLLVYVL